VDEHLRVVRLVPSPSFQTYLEEARHHA